VIIRARAWNSTSRTRSWIWFAEYWFDVEFGKVQRFACAFKADDQFVLEVPVADDQPKPLVAT
jgi:hypothetical protein